MSTHECTNLNFQRQFSIEKIMQKIILQISCNDQQGIISSVTGCIQSYQGNIMYINQHVDQIENRFNME